MTGAPLFILAPPRSFTSVVCAMIGQHPEMYGLPEVNVFVADTYAEFATSRHNSRKGFSHGLLRSVAQLALGDQSAKSVREARAWLEENADVPTAQLFLDLAAWAAPRRLVDKSPVYTYNLNYLNHIEAAIPDAFYLHLTRHPRGNCESLYRMREDTRKRREKRIGAEAAQAEFEERDAPMPTPAQMWLKPQETILKFLETIPPERQRRLRGEDFLADPDRHLPAICEWLGISTDPEALEAMKHPEASPYACFGPRIALLGNDPVFLESPALRRYHPKPMSFDGPLEGGNGAYLDEATAACARKLGYV
jgi:hypothetical protein